MSSLIYELKKNNHKNIFEVYNSPKEKYPIKLILDTPNKINTFQNKLKKKKKNQKILQIEKSRKTLDNNLVNKKMVEKIKDEYQNKRYNSNKKINIILSRNVLNEINYDDNEVLSPKYMNTARSNKFINNNYNKCTPIKFGGARKFLGGSPLVSHSIDIINNNPYNKRKFMKIENKRESVINKLLNKNNEETDDNLFGKNYMGLSPININLKQEIKFKNHRKLSYEKNNENELNCNQNYNSKKDILPKLYINNNLKNKKKNIILDEIFKDFNEKRKNLFIQFELEQNKENNEDINNKNKNNKINDKSSDYKIEQIKKSILKNIPIKLKNYYKNKKNNEEEEFYYTTKNKYKIKKEKNNDIEYISDDELKEYYISNCNVILEYAYKEDRNCFHKINMEDKGKSIINFNNDSNKLLFCLFDGHGGDEVSSYLQKNFGNKMKKYINNIDNEEIYFETLFKEIDEEFKHFKYYQIGSTATIIYITKNRINNKKILYCINIGDTKCILTQTTGSRKLSYDDLTTDENESNRIINEGGYIKNGRVAGQLMISRAFGDWEFKTSGVICSPHITKIEINDKCKYVIMASDGVWDVLDDLDVYKFSLSAENCKSLCDDIIQNALEKESTDNLSCFVIKLND